jgi:hypothetical protein
LASFIDDGGKDVKGEEAIREWLRGRLAEVRDETE